VGFSPVVEPDSRVVVSRLVAGAPRTSTTVRPVLVVEQPGARNERRASSRPPTDHGHATDTGYGGLDDIVGRACRGLLDHRGRRATGGFEARR
jgi:hypothetical protein